MSKAQETEKPYQVKRKLKQREVWLSVKAAPALGFFVLKIAPKPDKD